MFGVEAVTNFMEIRSGVSDIKYECRDPNEHDFPAVRSLYALHEKHT